MSDAINKLRAIAEQKQKLKEQESQLIEKRKREIGDFAERFDLLTASDKLIAGLFSEAEKAIKDKSEKIKHWESQGDKHIKPKRINSKSVETSTE